MNSIVKTLFRSQFVRNFAAKGKAERVIEKAHPKAKKIKELQRKFTCDDGVPVYLKGGPKDKILFQFTAAAVAVGLLLSIDVLYKLIMPGANPARNIPVVVEDEEEQQ